MARGSRKPATTERRVVHYSGHVQGVGFRYSTRSIAKGFSVVGFVKNLSDGRVQVVAEGEGDELDRFLAAVQERLGSYIVAQEVEILTAAGELSGFEIAF